MSDTNVQRHRLSTPLSYFDWCSPARVTPSPIQEYNISGEAWNREMLLRAL